MAHPFAQSSFLFYGGYMKKILKITGIMHIFYFLIMIAYAGARTTFSKFWLGMGSFWVMLSVLPEKFLTWLRIPLTAVAAVFFYQECEFVRMARREPKGGADYVIVLGAQVKGTRPSRSLLRRIEAAAEYLKKNPDTKVIASGGQGPREDITEAQCICETLINMGIDEERIFMEPISVSTWENLVFSAEMVGYNHKFVVVTNGFHLYRAVKTAKKLGMKHVSGLAAREEPVLLLNYYVREFFAWIVYRRRTL